MICINKNQIIILGVILLIVIVGVVFYSRSSLPSSNSTSDQQITQSSPTDNQASSSPSSDSSMSAEESPNANSQVKQLIVTGSNFKFEPSTLTINKGDKVKITFKNSAGVHDFVIDEFNVKTDTISGGQDASVEFTASKTGTFEYYCSIGNHRAMGMVGTLTVQ
ncbi:cupredoxin domain-containing protein [Candidatus Daviesbacteria bacterium]|nr:cupredoxin domain-containing protein [Candidatus Daviesbacteria bacterium]